VISAVTGAHLIHLRDEITLVHEPAGQLRELLLRRRDDAGDR
jgi:hypothetical protein